MSDQKSDCPKPTVAQSSSIEETVDQLLSDEKIKEIIKNNQFL